MLVVTNMCLFQGIIKEPSIGQCTKLKLSDANISKKNIRRNKKLEKEFHHFYDLFLKMKYVIFYYYF